MDEKKLDMKQNMLWNTVGNLTYLVFQWLITIIIVRLTGYYEAGLFSLAMSVTNIYYSIATWGMRTYQVSDVVKKYSDREYIFSRFLTCIAAVLICYVFCGFNSYSFEQLMVICVYMIFRASEAYVDVIHGIDQKKWRMDYIGKSFMMRGVGIFIIFTVSLWIKKNILFSVILLTLISIAIIILYDTRRMCQNIKADKTFSVKKVFLLLLETLPLAVYIFMSTAISSLPRYELERQLGTEMLGIYASIATPAVIIQAAASYLMGPIVTPLAESLENADERQFWKLIRNTMITLGVVFAAALIGSRILGQWGLRLLFGESIVSYAYVLIPVVCCVIAVSCSWFINMILTVVRSFKGLIISNSLALIVALVSSKWFIMKFGINGTSDVTVLAFVIQILVGIFFCVIECKKKFNKIRKQVE